MMRSDVGKNLEIIEKHCKVSTTIINGVPVNEKEITTYSAICPECKSELVSPSGTVSYIQLVDLLSNYNDLNYCPKCGQKIILPIGEVKEE